MLKGGVQGIYGIRSVIRGLVGMNPTVVGTIPTTRRMIPSDVGTIPTTRRMVPTTRRTIPTVVGMVRRDARMIRASAQMVPGDAQVIKRDARMVPRDSFLIGRSHHPVSGSRCHPSLDKEGRRSTPNSPPCLRRGGCPRLWRADGVVRNAAARASNSWEVAQTPIRHDFSIIL
jgi:hypothetical protein